MKKLTMTLALGICIALMLTLAVSFVMATQEDSASSDQYGGSSDQYGPDWDGATPIEDPMGNVLSTEPVLGNMTNGLPFLGGFFGGEQGGFVNHDIGPLLESETRGSTEACTKCHTNVVGTNHNMNVKPASGTDCYLCHTKHVACAMCHEMGKPGDSITNMVNGRMDAFGVPLDLPPIIDDGLREVPLIDVHKAIAHGGLILEYAPGDLGGIVDTTRALTGDDPSHNMAGTIRETDNTLQDETLWKLNELPLVGQQSEQADPSASISPDGLIQSNPLDIVNGLNVPGGDVLNAPGGLLSGLPGSLLSCLLCGL